ncbi:MAG: hypothetical protein HND57_09280 [Planctomycetes bacterium]|nr:hypothetical protein [Planctomycetota bacterium]
MNRSTRRITAGMAQGSVLSAAATILIWSGLSHPAAISQVTASQAPDPPAEPTLMRVRLPADDHPDLALTLEAAGFDVLPTSAAAGAIDLIVNQQELDALTQMHLQATLVDRGRPLRDILAEQGLIDGVPPGYLDLDEILAAMADCAAAKPSICELVDLTERYQAPTTYEGRHLWAVRISDNVNVDEDESALLIVGDHHAREIVTPVICLYAMEQLTSLYGIDPAVTDAVDNHEIWIAPTWNPDGYAYVFSSDNYWRKNRVRYLPEQAVGVDQNRNYPSGWYSSCSGSSDPYSSTYKGPLPASESETQTMMLWSVDQRFSRVIDYHSYGREVLYAYRCRNHPLFRYLESEAAALARSSGYGASIRPPSADGEHYQWQVFARIAHGFLIETHREFQPSYSSAVAEAASLWPGILEMAGRTASLYGHVTDASTGMPVAARIRFAIGTEILREQAQSESTFGRYDLFLPPGQYRMGFIADGYRPQGHDVTIEADGNPTVLEVALEPR